MLLIIISGSFYKTFNTFLNNVVNGNLTFKTLIVFRNNTNIEEIEKISGVQYAVFYDSYSTYVKTDKGEEILLYGVPNDFVKTLYGNQLNNYKNEEKVLLCPSKFYLGNNPEEMNEEFLKNLHDGKEYLNQNLTFVGNNYSQIFKIVGIYSENNYTYKENNICFTSFENIKEIRDKNVDNICNNCDGDLTCEINCDPSNFPIYVILEDSSLKTSVSSELLDRGYEVREVSHVDVGSINLISRIILGISIMVLIIVFIILLIANTKFTQYNKKNNLLYETMGYDSKIVARINYIEGILLSIVSFLITLLLTWLLYHLLNKIFLVDIETGGKIYLSTISIFCSFFTSIIISLLSIFLSIKDRKPSIIGDLLDREI